MSKIKVTVKDIKTANEIIKFWKDEELNLEIVVKENTATANSDVKESPFRTQVVSDGKLIELD